ncbi:MAG TPA: hypothetical protein VM219_02460 [Phycisphaerae bacterium]|nr:hypothetical protein [Phycisphaerae bacterium]
MRPGFEITKVLITVMTYPQPSRKYQETVCTAGITESGKWVRLYPIDYRYRPEHQKFRKWQWVEVALAPWGHGTDQRPESREPELSTLRTLGEPLSTKGDWQERRTIIDGMPHYTVKELEALYESDRTSLGIVRPKRVLDLKVTPVERDWPAKHKALWSQLRLFGEQKPLRKIPYKFQYVFECEDSDKPYKKMNEDWELGVLFLKELDKKGSEEEAIRSVRHNFLEVMCREDRDTRFFVGTYHPYNEWLVVGTFWPPKQYQKPLFSL